MLTWIQSSLSALDAATEAIMATLESILVAVGGRVATWAAPLPSAIMVRQAAVSTFGLDAWLGWCVAIAVEAVGIAASHRWIEARDWNARAKKDKRPKEDERNPQRVMISYFVITEIILCAFEFRTFCLTGEPWGFTALLFPPLSFVAVVTMNERIAHYHLRQEWSESGEGVKVSKKRERLDTLLTLYRDNPLLSPTDAAKALGVSRQTIYTHLAALETDGVIRRNGHGVEVLT